MENKSKRLFIHFQSDLLPALFNNEVSVKPPVVYAVGIGNISIHRLDIMAMNAVGLVVHAGLKEPKSRLSADDIWALADIIRKEPVLEICIIKPVSPVSVVDLLMVEDTFLFDRCLITPVERFDDRVLIDFQNTKIKHQKPSKPLNKVFNSKKLQKKDLFIVRSNEK